MVVVWSGLEAPPTVWGRYVGFGNGSDYNMDCGVLQLIVEFIARSVLRVFAS